MVEARLSICPSLVSRASICFKKALLFISIIKYKIYTKFKFKYTTPEILAIVPPQGFVPTVYQFTFWYICLGELLSQWNQAY